MQARKKELGRKGARNRAVHSARAASRTAAGEAVRGGAILGGLAHKASTFRARRGWTSTLPAHKASTFPLGEENARSEASARRQRNDGEMEDTGMREQGGGQFSARARRGEQGEDTLLNKDTQDKKASTFVGAKTRRRAALSQVLAAPPSPQQGGGRSARREGRKRRATARHGVKRRRTHTYSDD